MPTTPSHPTLRELAAHDRPQERLERLGPGSLTDAELLAMLLRSGSQGLDVIALSTQIMAEAGSLANLVGYRPEDYARFRGVGKIKALKLITVMEVARRVSLQTFEERPLLDRASVVQQYLGPRLQGLEVEVFWVLALNNKNRLLKLISLTSGTTTVTLAHPRDVYREAVRAGATGIICAHNHPSDDPTPSLADIHLTRQLRDAGRVLQVPMLDHVILARPTATHPTGYFSFLEAGLLGRAD